MEPGRGWPGRAQQQQPVSDTWGAEGALQGEGDSVEEVQIKSGSVQNNSGRPDAAVGSEVPIVTLGKGHYWFLVLLLRDVLSWVLLHCMVMEPPCMSSRLYFWLSRVLKTAERMLCCCLYSVPAAVVDVVAIVVLKCIVESC